jgi:predicted NUDIX family NTP pyrophosphohydrolase
MQKRSAGILIYHFKNNIVEVLLVHPGGPLWAKKDLGVWSIPKGEFDDDEKPLDAAKREVKEETGIIVEGDFIELTPVKLKSGKLVYAWAVEGNFITTEIKSNTFEMEWPPKSGQKKPFPEVDKAAWFNLNEAKEKINIGQIPLIDELEIKIKII